MREDSKEIIDRWLSRINSQEIILVIGAGFTKNALIDGLDTSASSIIPLWSDLILSVQKKMNLFSFDSLLSFDIYRDFYGMRDYQKLLLDAMPNDNLKPGKAHEFLSRMPKIKAIITTNNIDTLLDMTFNKAKKIIKDTDIVEGGENGLNIIYLHGHRNYPESWVFSRTDYDDITTKYPLKSSLCRHLLATYPSLFLGFGYSDQDLHSIMRYVNRTVNDYKPAMLSLAISGQNTFLSEYWGRLGLSIAVIHSDDDKVAVAQCLVEALKYIAESRINKLIEDGKLLPGYRNEKSFMDTLKEHKFACKRRDNNLIVCDYHESRRNAEIYRLPQNSGIISISAYTAWIKPNSAAELLIKKMHNGYVPAGSWGLMPTHREWLMKGLCGYKQKSDTIRILIAGIAGLPHFVDTMSIIIEHMSKRKKIDITVADICVGPLMFIDRFINQKGSVPVQHECALYSRLIEEIRKREVKISLINCDLLKPKGLSEESFDIILSHHLITTCKNDNYTIVEKYIDALYALLKREGILISAQNFSADELTILTFQKMVENKGLRTLDAMNVFDVYDYNVNEITRRGNGMYVSKETLLAIHRKEK